MIHKLLAALYGKYGSAIVSSAIATYNRHYAIIGNEAIALTKTREYVNRSQGIVGKSYGTR